MNQKSKLPIKEVLIKKIAIKKRVSESIVKEVIDDQFKNIVRAMKTNNTVEVTGFGKFIFIPKRAEMLSVRLQEALDKKLRGEEDKKVLKDIDTLKEEILYLNQKCKDVRASEKHSRGLEECVS